MSISEAHPGMLAPLAIAAGCLAHVQAVQALEVTGGDYEIYPAGVNIGLLYYRRAESRLTRS